MSVADPDVVDAVGTDPASGEVILTIADHLDWGDAPDDHAAALESKIDSYIRFLESGQVYEDYPAAKGRQLRIDVVLKYPPDDIGLAWLRAAQAEVARRGHRLSWRVPDHRMDELRNERAGEQGDGADERRPD